MAYRLEHTEDPPVLRLTFVGHVTPDEVATAAAQVLETARRTGCYRVLGDCTAMEGGHSLFDLYGVIERLAQAENVQRFAEALVLPSVPGLQTHAEFWETACRNRGVDVKVVPDRATGIAWLLALSTRGPGGTGG